MKTLTTIAATATIYMIAAAILFFAPVWVKEGLWIIGVSMVTFMIFCMAIFHEDQQEISPFLGVMFLMTANLPMDFMAGWNISMNEAMSIMLVCFLVSGGLFAAFTHQKAFQLLHGFDPFDSYAWARAERQERRQTRRA